MDKYLVSPTPLTKPIATDGEYAVIPENQKEVGDGRASISTGFPVETSIPLSEGGKVVRRVDENGFLNLFSKFIYWMQSGGQALYNSSLNYVPNNMVVHNNIFWVCKTANGPDNGGVVAPGANTNYWVSLSSSIGVDDILKNYLKLSGGTLTGSVTFQQPVAFNNTTRAPTVSTNDRSTNVATTAWVKNQGYLNQQIGAATLYSNEILVQTGSGNISSYYPAVQRDAWGRVTKVGRWKKSANCNCNCDCNCDCADSDTDGD